MENLAFDLEGERNYNTFNSKKDVTHKPKSIEIKNVSLDKNIGLVSCVVLIIGTVIGSGIFLSPQGVLIGSGSVGLTLIIWIICGFFTTMGALAFTELGTLFPSSGGQYIYFLEGFAPNRREEKAFWGPLVAFLFGFQEIFFARPASFAIQGLACSTYLMKITTLGCGLDSISSAYDELKIKIFAATFVIVITTINCCSVNFSTRIINVFTASKLIALSFIVIGGLVTLLQGNTKVNNFDFEGTNFKFSGIALAFYSGLWAYRGWDKLTLVGREIKDPEKNIIRSMVTSCVLITILYVAVNASYFLLMTKSEFLSSEAVAVDFGTRLGGYYGGTYIVISVVLSIFGSTVGESFTSARISYAAAREGHMVNIISFLNVRHSTPSTALMLTCMLSLFLIGNSDILNLIFLSGFLNSFFMSLSMVLVFVFRKTKKNDKRIRVTLLAPTLALIFFIFLTVTPFIEKPKVEYIYCLIFMGVGVLLYIPFVYYECKIQCLDKIKLYLQVLLEVVPPQDDEI